VGAFAIGVAVVRLVVGRLRDFGDVMSALGALLLGGAAVGCVFAPLVPAVALGVWVLLGTASLVLFDI